MAENAGHNVSLIDTEQYHRLVRFLDEMHSYAEDTCDSELMEKVESCRDDLISSYGEMHDYSEGNDGSDN